MAREYEEYSKALRGTLRDQFRKANPEYWEKLQDRPHDVERVQEVLKQAEQQIERIELDYKESRLERIRDESVLVWNARAQMSQKSPQEVQDHVLSTNSVLQQARENVDLMHGYDVHRENEEAQETIQQIVNAEHRNPTYKSNEEIETMSDTDKEKSFKAEIHAAIQSRKTAEYQARKLFSSTREEMISTARENGSETPEQDVKGMYRGTMQNIESQCHRDIHEVFERYGWEYDKQNVSFQATVSEQEIDQAEHTGTEPSPDQDHDHEQ